MKNKIIIPIIACIILIVTILGFIIWNNRVVTTITMDINPSIEINLNKNKTVKSINAFNDESKEIISDDLVNKSIDEVIWYIANKLIDNGYVKDNKIEIILYTNGELNNEQIESRLKNAFNEKSVNSEIVLIENITKEDMELAKKYSVSPAKVSYIKSIIEENDNIKVEDLANKSTNELIETKERGKYCERGYTLEGDWCLKEINRINALEGNVCPNGYIEYEGKCYGEIKAIESNDYSCNKDFKLLNDKCISKQVYDAIGKCDSGEYKDGYCITKEYMGDAKEYCRITPGTDLLYNGRCLGRKPTINGRCIGGDKLISGYCYDTSASSGYKADWRCPDGTLITNPDGSLMNEDKKCYKETKTKPTSYYCENDGILNETKCEITTIEDPQKLMTCPNGTKPLDDGSRCLDFNKVVSKENGYYCNQENSRLVDKTCVIYEMIEAKTN